MAAPLTTALFAAALALVGNIVFGFWRRNEERRSIAAALAGEIGAYVRLLDPPTFVANLRQIAALDHAARRKSLRLVPRAPDGHPVFDKVADKIGLLPVDEARDVSSIYNVVTGMRIAISRLSSDAFVDADDEHQAAQLCALADGLDRNFRDAHDLIERLRRISLSLPVRGAAWIRAALRGE